MNTLQRHPVDSFDAFWLALRCEVEQCAQGDPQLAAFLHENVLRWRSWAEALTHAMAMRLHVAQRLPGLDAWQTLLTQALAGDGALAHAATRDLKAIVQRDPASAHLHVPFLFYKGFHALQIHRVAHWYWTRGRHTVAYLLQHRCAEVLAIDIHPAARIGMGVMLDHGTGFVAGETAVIEDDVNLLHAVTLGGTGKQCGDRHPKVRRGASIGAGAMILGNIEIGPDAKVGAGSVVLDSLAGATTAVGFRSRVIQTPEARWAEA